MSVRGWWCAGAVAAAGVVVIGGWAAGALAGCPAPWENLKVRWGGLDVERTA